MTSKLSWATAAILIVAAVAVGTWAVWGQAPVTPPPSEGGWNMIVGGTLGEALAMTAHSPKSGIENFRIMKHGTYNPIDNLDVMTAENRAENLLGSATATSFDFNITYDTSFDIVVEVVGHDDNMGSVDEAFLKVELGATTDSGGWSITADNSSNDTEYAFGTPGANSLARNAVWDNSGNGYRLKADDNLNITSLKLWLRS